jgi:hypothetical protein
MKSSLWFDFSVTMTTDFSFFDYEFLTFGEDGFYHFIGDDPENLYGARDFFWILNKHWARPGFCFVYDYKDHAGDAIFEASYAQIYGWNRICKYRKQFGDVVVLVFDDYGCEEKKIAVRESDLAKSCEEARIGLVHDALYAQLALQQ